MKIYLQPNSYLSLTVYVYAYFDFLNPVTIQINRFLGFQTLSYLILIWIQDTLSKKLCQIKYLRINVKIYVQQ